MSLISHASPKRLYLRSHIASVKAASEGILRQSTRAHWHDTWATPLLFDLAHLHDLGKASAAFQQYIAAPESWTGGSLAKAHTPLSLVLTMHHARAQGWDDTIALAAALAVRGHHGGQPASGEVLASGLIDDAVFSALRAQLSSIDHGTLCDEATLSLPPWPDATALIDDTRDAIDDHLSAFRKRPLSDAARARFLARAAFSVLLEADKAFLAIDTARLRDYLDRPRHDLPARLVDDHASKQRGSPMDSLRADASVCARDGFARHSDARLLTLTLPTGAGKTLIAARWALSQRQPDDALRADAPTIIVALPMLAIVDQTESVWRHALTERGVAPLRGEALLASHSLSDRAYETEPDRDTADFFLDTWRSEVVVTTFDQLLMAMYSDRARHAMRYHRLLNAVIVLDEVQCIPPALWEALSQGFNHLTTLGSTRVLAMSATQPRCIDGAVEVLDDPRALYRRLDRYKITLHLDAPTAFDAFTAQVVATCTAACAAGERTLATVNTRATAQSLYLAVETELRARGLAAPVLLSGDLTPSHRLRVIDDVRAKKVATVVSTQCVEAGVDIDMDHVLRDLCPFDALVQIAGRCNRNSRRSTHGSVSLFDVVNPRGVHESTLIYDEVLLYATREVLRGQATLDERDVFDLCERWFALVAASKDRGHGTFAKWARLRDAIDLKKLLRGEERGQESVVVIEQDAALEGAWLRALEMGRRDHWEGRSELRKLAPRVAAVSVSVPSWRFETLHVREMGGLMLLTPGQYHPVRGIDSRRRA